MSSIDWPGYIPEAIKARRNRPFRRCTCRRSRLTVNGRPVEPVVSTRLKAACGKASLVRSASGTCCSSARVVTGNRVRSSSVRISAGRMPWESIRRRQNGTCVKACSTARRRRASCSCRSTAGGSRWARYCAIRSPAICSAVTRPRRGARRRRPAPARQAPSPYRPACGRRAGHHRVGRPTLSGRLRARSPRPQRKRRHDR